MSRGDDFPRYTYMMDFNPMDEDTPLRDYWQTTDDLDNEDAATIASLATQVLQAKSGYEYGESLGLEVNEPGVVANYMYSESRSSPQSQYSTTLPTEPAESFRGLMDDHDRGARMIEEGAASEYDFEPETRGHESSDVNGTDEPTMLSREQYAPETFRSTLYVAAEVDVTNQSSYTHETEMSAAMTASRVVNGVLSRSYAGTPTEEAVNLQALQSQAPQLTPPHSESRSELKEPAMETDDQHVDDEPENALMTKDDEGEDWEEDQGGQREDNEGEEREDNEGEEREEDEGGEREEDEGGEREEDEAGEREEDHGGERKEDEAGERAENEGGERVEDDEGERFEDEGDRKEDGGGEGEGDEAGETEKDEMDEEEPTPDTGAQQQLIKESNERPVVDDDEELPPLQQTPRKRGRPRRSDAAEAPPALTSEQPTAVQIAVREEDTHTGNEEMEAAVTDDTDLNRAEEIPTGRKRGRPRKSEVSEPATAAAPTPAKRRPGRPPKATDIELTLAAAPAAGKRGRPRKNSIVDATQLSAIALDLSTAETPTTTTPRKSNMVNAATQTSPNPTQLPVTETTRSKAPSGKRGRPRKSDVSDTAQASTTADREMARTLVTSTNAAPARTSSKRGRPRKSDMTGATQASTEELEQPTVEVAENGAPSGKRGRPRKSDVAANAVQEAVVAVPRSSSKRGRPRKSDMMGAAQASTEELEPLDVETSMIATPIPSKRGRPPKSAAISATLYAAVTTTPASSKRGRPRKMPRHEAQLPTDEAPPTTTPASREIQPKASVETSTATPGRRGRPPKGLREDATQAVDSPALRGRPPRQADTLEERADSPSPLPTKKRGRGRPATVEPGLGMGAQQAEPQESSTPMDDVLKDLDVGETASTPAQEDMEATPVRKRGRPKVATADKSLSKKKHVQEEEEEPAAKRRRTNNDMTMEDAVDEDETRGDAQEDELPNRSSVTWAQPLTSTLTEPETVAIPSPQRGRRHRLSGEMPEESTKTKQVEQPTAAPPRPKTLFDMISDGRKMR
ncbi:hypothetical protein GGI35DRAFT_467641 [Trichoderma velutinum]